jgi:TRAP-type C4-dicarboxylate transport system substrate-binding protein
MLSFVRCGLLAAALASSVSAASAEPIKLKLSYFSSDRTTTYHATIKPFVDAVNAQAAGLLEIEVYFSGALGKNPAQQLELVRDGKADLAFIAPGYTPERFPDTTVIELPGLFHNIREATLTYTALVAADRLRGYEDLLVVGAFATAPESIHTRPPAASLDALKGMRIRANNPTQGAALARLGMVPVQLPITKTAGAISSGEIDGAMVGPAPMVEFGIARVAPNHYLLGVSSAPLAVVMNRKVFEGLPARAQEIIRKLSGAWTAEHYIATYQAENQAALRTLESDPNRRVVIPSAADLERAHDAFTAEIELWSADPRHRELLAAARAELDKLRAGTMGRR